MIRLAAVVIAMFQLIVTDEKDDRVVKPRAIFRSSVAIFLSDCSFFVTTEDYRTKNENYVAKMLPKINQSFQIMAVAWFCFAMAQNSRIFESSLSV